jgi:hypothetical protein
MAVFDITDIVTGLGRDQYDVFYRPDRFKNIMTLVGWLKEHVGEYYGTGEDHTMPDDVQNNSGTSIIRIGSGWQIERDWRGDPNGYVEVWWKLDITDEIKASFFALKWVK